MKTEAMTADEWLAWASEERAQGRLAEAAAGFRRALEAAPNSVPAKFALAQLLLDSGDLAGASVLADDIAADGPTTLELLWLKARLAMATASWEDARNLLQTLLSRPGLNELQTAEARLLLGLALGEIGDAGAAFDAAATGKALQRRYYARQAAARESEPHKLRRLKTWLDRHSESFGSAAASDGQGPAAQHVFLLGFPRSGTTLLEQLLAAHPQVRTLEEEPLLAGAYEAFLANEAACESLAKLSPDEAAAWAEHYWRSVAARVADVRGKLFVDKQPAGTLNLPIIARLFPRAKILFAIRDPRDVVLSCFRQSFQMNAMTYAFTDLRETADCYDACMTFAVLARARLPLDWADVRHEALIEDFEGELDRILHYLGLTRHDSMIDVAATANTRPIRTPSAMQVRAGLNRRGLGRWHQYVEALEPVFPTLAPWVERFGYAA